LRETFNRLSRIERNVLRFAFLEKLWEWAKHELTTEEMERNCFSHR